MIDTYMDRCDMATGFNPTARYISVEDPRYFMGDYHDSVVSCNAAKARYNLKMTISTLMTFHRWELSNSILLGSTKSSFLADGKRKHN